LAIAVLSMAVAAAMLTGACSGAAPGPDSAAGELPGKPKLSLTYIKTDTGIEVSWLPPESDSAITGYDVRHRTTSGSWNTTSGLAENTTSFAITNLEADVDYLIQVRATSSAGSGEWSEPLLFDPMENGLLRATSAASDATDTGNANAPILITGTEGDDYIFVDRDSDDFNLDYHIDALGGDDRVFSGAGNDYLRGGAGVDRLYGWAGNDTIEGGSGNDYLVGSFGDDTLHGGADRDRLSGGPGADLLRGDDGDDRLEADDFFGSGDGNDTLVGGAGADYFVFAAHLIYNFGEDVDTIKDFAPAEDMIDLTAVRGARSFNHLKFDDDGSTALVDLSEFAAGMIRLEGVNSESLGVDNFALPEWQFGDDGNNTLVGGESANNIDGFGGDDSIQGGRKSDYLIGGDGNDQLDGLRTSDVLDGGAGDDTLTGGLGKDYFLFAAGHGNDTITDFGNVFDGGHQGPPGDPGDPGRGLQSFGGSDATEYSYRTGGFDLIRSSSISGSSDYPILYDFIVLTQFRSISSYSDLVISADGTTAVIDLTAHGGGTIRLEDVAVGDLRSSNFKYYDPSRTL
jgi:Ca2+-binding RTX toxin-like protein